MDRLIQDLLDVALIEERQLGLARMQLRPAPLLVEAAETQRALAKAASIEIQVELGGPLPDVCADQHRVLQVFENLIGNALKFTPPGGRITLGAAPAEREVTFWVTDTGSGIAPDHLPHIFDRFWKARSGTRQSAGLGLSITRGIVEAHGGRMWVQSTPGRGTTFFFTLPQQAGQEHPDAEKSHGDRDLAPRPA
jgi:signal transduction histidine kinase